MDFQGILELFSFRNLSDLLTDYWAQANLASFKFWLVPLITVMTLLLLVFIIAKIINREGSSQEALDAGRDGKERFKISAMYGVQLAWMIGSSFTALGLVIWISILSGKGGGFRSSFDLATVLTLVIVMIVPIATIWKLRGSFTRNRLKNLATQARTPEEERRYVITLNRVFRLSKLWVLIPLLGLAILLIPGQSKRSLVAIVLDNSGSMEEEIAFARRSLGELLPRFAPGSTFIISTFDGEGERRSIDEIMEVGFGEMDGALAGAVFEATSPISAIAHIDGIVADQPSPICEAIWKTYLHASAGGYQSASERLLIVVTDGEDTEASNLELDDSSIPFFDSDPDFTAVFPRQSVHLVDVRGMNTIFNFGDGQPFFDAGARAGFQIQDASNSRFFSGTLDRLLRPLTIDPRLVYLTVLILLTAIIVVALISTRKIRPVKSS